MVQIFYAFWIAYIDILLIESADSPVDLIQNFAGLLILLEFDNYVLMFFRNLGVYNYLKQFLEFIDDDFAQENQLKNVAKKEKKAILKRKKKNIKEEMEKAEQKVKKFSSPGHKPKKDQVEKPIIIPPAPKISEVVEIVKKIKKDSARRILTFSQMLDLLESGKMGQVISQIGQDRMIKKLLTKSQYRFDRAMKEKFEEKEQVINLSKLFIMLVGVGIAVGLA